MTPADEPAEPPAAAEAVQGYVISLARRPDRRERFVHWNAQKGIALSMFDAIDGRTLRRQDLLSGDIIADASLGFSGGALGNAMSHRALWKTCVALGRPIMIFEDDAFLSDHTREWVDTILAEVQNGCDIFFLGYNRDAILSIGYGGQWCNLAFEPQAGDFEAAIRQINRAGEASSRAAFDVRLVWGTLGYALSPRGAQTLLQRCFPMSDKIPVRMYGSGRMMTPYALDGILNVVIQQGRVRARTVFPPLVIGPNEQADSDVVRQLAQSQQRTDG
jgi:glycosyl transferase, family 25